MSKAFQSTRSRTEAAAALPPLVTYYSLLRPAAPAAFDTEALARRELDWWQARREVVAPRDYGVTVAEVAAFTYGTPAGNPDIRAFGIGRAEAMAYRDACGPAITDDWADIEAQLRSAYQRAPGRASDARSNQSRGVDLPCRRQQKKAPDNAGAF